MTFSQDFKTFFVLMFPTCLQIEWQLVRRFLSQLCLFFFLFSVGWTRRQELEVCQCTQCPVLKEKCHYCWELIGAIPPISAYFKDQKVHYKLSNSNPKDHMLIMMTEMQKGNEIHCGILKHHVFHGCFFCPNLNRKKDIIEKDHRSWCQIEALAVVTIIGANFPAAEGKNFNSHDILKGLKGRLKLPRLIRKRAARDNFYVDKRNREIFMDWQSNFWTLCKWRAIFAEIPRSEKAIRDENGGWRERKKL